MATYQNILAASGVASDRQPVYQNLGQGPENDYAHPVSARVRADMVREPNESFGIRFGGGDSSCPSIIIAQLKPGSPAAKCGKLSIGDEVLEINGTQLVSMSVPRATSLLKQAENNCFLIVVPATLRNQQTSLITQQTNARPLLRAQSSSKLRSSRPASTSRPVSMCSVSSSSSRPESRADPCDEEEEEEGTYRDIASVREEAKNQPIYALREDDTTSAAPPLLTSAKRGSVHEMQQRPQQPLPSTFATLTLSEKTQPPPKVTEVSRKEAKSMLLGKPAGTYLVRQKPDGSYAVAVSTSCDSVENFILVGGHSGNLGEIIEYYKHTKDALPVLLRDPL